MEEIRLKGNWGKLRSIPEVSVNKFLFKEEEYKKVTMFILTHLDEGIVKEVLDMRFLRKLCLRRKLRLFMHPILYECLLHWTSIMKEPINIRSYLDEMRQNGKIVLYKTNKTFIIQIDEPKRLVEVTILDSGYDLGSIMLLFEVFNFYEENEFSFQRILYTGNCRLFTKDLKMIPFFWNEDGTVKKFDELHVDTTYLFDEIQELPLREESSDQLVEFLKNQLLLKPSRKNIYYELDKFLPGRLTYLAHIMAEHPIFTPPKHLELFSSIQKIMNETTARYLGDRRGPFGQSKLLTSRQCKGSHTSKNTTIVLREELYRPNSNNSNSCTKSLKYKETNEKFSFGKSLTPSADKNRITWSYFSHLSRYEIARLIRTLNISVTVDTFIPLHTAKEHNIHETIDLVKQSLLEISLSGEERPAYEWVPYAAQYSTFQKFQPTPIPEMRNMDFYHFYSDGEREIKTVDDFDNFKVFRQSIRQCLN